MVDSVSPNAMSQDSAQLWMFFNRKREAISLNHWAGGQSHHHPSPNAVLSTSCDLSLDVILFPHFVPTVCEITKGEAKEVNYLFFMSIYLIYGKNHSLGKVLCGQMIWQVCYGWKWIDMQVPDLKLVTL